MKTELETATEARSEFDRAIVASGILDNDDLKLGEKALETLYGVFWAGVCYGVSRKQEKAPESPRRNDKPYPKSWPKRKPGEKIEVKDPNAQATDAQYRYIKSLYAGDEAKARAIMSSDEYNAIVADLGVLNRGGASDLINRLVQAGIKPKRK